MIVAFSGQIASGKSTLSKLLADKTGWSRFSFGDYVRMCAKNIGLDANDRETLQDLGVCLSKRPEPFVRGFLEWTGTPENMIIDGIRHFSIFLALKAQVHEPIRLAFVDTPSQTAQDRYSGDLAQARGHAVESDVEALKDHADWVLNNSSEGDLVVVLAALGVT